MRRLVVRTLSSSCSGKPPTSLHWQQVPAWLLGLAAIAGGAALIAFPKHLTSDQSRDAWAAVIVALFLAALLSYRSALTINSDDERAGQQSGGDGAAGQPEGEAQPPVAPNAVTAGDPGGQALPGDPG